MLSDYPSQETSTLGFLANVASNPPPKVDLTVVIVAVVGAISAIAVAYYQYGRRQNAEGKVKSAEQESKKATDSETAMAGIAERSLALLESLLENEKKENAALTELLQVANDKVAEKNAAIEQLMLQIQEKNNKIRELEYELHRLRGHLDSLLGSKKGPSNASSSEV